MTARTPAPYFPQGLDVRELRGPLNQLAQAVNARPESAGDAQDGSDRLPADPVTPTAGGEFVLDAATWGSQSQTVNLVGVTSGNPTATGTAVRLTFASYDLNASWFGGPDATVRIRLNFPDVTPT